MARKTRDQANTLTLEATPTGYRLFGYLNGKSIRKQGSDLVKLEQEKARLEQSAVAQKAAVLTTATDTKALSDAYVARQLLADAKITLTEAVQLAVKHVGTGQPIDLTLAIQDYVDYLAAERCGERHIRNTRVRLTAFAGFVKAKKAVKVGDVTPEHIEAYVLRAKVSGYTALGDATVIRAFFTHAIQTRKWLRSSPFGLDMKKLRKRAVRDRERPIIMSPEDAQALLYATIATDGASHVPYLILQLWGGIRRSEVERLDSRDLRFEDGHFIVTIDPSKAKTASYREVHLPPSMNALLQQCLSTGLLDENPIGAPIERTWAEIRAKAGLVRITQREPYMLVESIRWADNILRHTGISYYYRKTGNVAETARQAGHSKEMSFAHYITLTRPEDAPKFYSITGSLTHPEAASKVA